MSEEEYKKNEIDLMHEHIHKRLGNIEDGVNALNQKVDYTNGKVKKIIIALVALGAFSVGLGIQEAETLLTLL